MALFQLGGILQTLVIPIKISKANSPDGSKSQCHHLFECALAHTHSRLDSRRRVEFAALQTPSSETIGVGVGVHVGSAAVNGGLYGMKGSSWIGLDADCP